MKYAVLEQGGKQYLARVGETIEVDHLPLEVGQTISFKNVLMVVDGKEVRVGTPTVEGARVTGSVAAQTKARKVVVFKYIPKERYRRKRGHRQRYTRVTIEAIDLGDGKKKATAPRAATKRVEEPVKKPSRSEAAVKGEKTTGPKAAKTQPKKATRGAASKAKPESPKKKASESATKAKPKESRSASKEGKKPASKKSGGTASKSKSKKSE